MSKIPNKLANLNKYLFDKKLIQEFKLLSKYASEFNDEDFSKAFIGKEQIKAQQIFSQNKDISFFSDFTYIYPSDKGEQAAKAFLKNSPTHPLKTYAKYNGDSINICDIFGKVSDAQMFFIIKGNPQYALYGSSEGSKSERATGEEIRSVVPKDTLESLRQNIGEVEVPILVPKDINIEDRIFFDKDSFEGTKQIKSGLIDFHEVMLTESKIIGIIFNDKSSRLAYELNNLKPTISLFYCNKGVIYTDVDAYDILENKYKEIDYDVVSGDGRYRSLSEQARLAIETVSYEKLRKIVNKFIDDSEGLEFEKYIEFLGKIDDNPYFSGFENYKELLEYKKEISDRLLFNLLQESKNYTVIPWEVFDKEFCKKYMFEDYFIINAIKETFKHYYNSLEAIIKSGNISELPYYFSPFIYFLEEMNTCIKNKKSEDIKKKLLDVRNAFMRDIDLVFSFISKNNLQQEYDRLVAEEYYDDDDIMKLYSRFTNIK